MVVGINSNIASAGIGLLKAAAVLKDDRMKAAAQKQLEICLVRMPDQSLPDNDARQLLEFMRKNDGVK